MSSLAEVTSDPSATPKRPPDFYRSLVRGEERGLKALLLRTGLAVLSWPYGLAVGTRNWLFDHHWKRTCRAAVPVVSIGNLTLGGTGKTPAVEYLARFYHRHGVRVAILSRGYGSPRGRNDEARMLEANLPDVPHLQGADRVALAGIAVEQFKSNALILDDGFQHRRLHRDLDIVLIDATDPWGHGWLFPRGLLREPWRSLRRAGLILLTRCDQVLPEHLEKLRTEVQQIAPVIPLVESIHAPQGLLNADQQEAPLSLLEGRSVAAVCGIGNPEAFRRTLASLGCRVRAWKVFPDHYCYSSEDVATLRHWARQEAADLVVTTQKDLVKLPLTQLGGRPLWAVRIALGITAGQGALDRKLKGVLE